MNLRKRLLPALGSLGLFALAVALAGCGGSSGTTAGNNTVNVSLAAAPQNSAGTVSAAASAAEMLARPTTSDNVDHVFVTIHRIALIRVGDGAPPRTPLDPDGEWAVEDPDGGNGIAQHGHVATDIEPVTVDLLNLPSGQVARFLNAFRNVPAGTYGKIRLFYDDPKFHRIGAIDNTPIHTTGHGHLDIHFVGQDLVIPVATDPAGGVSVHNVTVTFVLGKDGLKITETGNGKFNMRPQVFATVSDVQFVVTGVADNVNKESGTFDLVTAGGRSFHAEFDVDTAWFFRESARWISVESGRGILALRNGAVVDVLGFFDTRVVLLADDVLITFPAVAAGTVASGTAESGWNPDNTFLLDRVTDNVVVFPQPDRASALYDNNAFPFPPLTDAAIVLGAGATARGYAVPGGVEAFWISVGP